MKKKLLAVLLVSLAVSSQEEYRDWSYTRLKQEDFTGSPAGSVPFQIKYDLVYFKKRQKIEKTHHVHYSVKAIFIPSESWMVNDSLAPLRLRYCNLVFDFVELYARRLDDEINVTEDFQRSKTETIRAINDVISTIASETKFGQKEERVAFWEHHIDSVLQVTFRKDVPDYRYDRLTLGYYWGAAYNQLTGALGEQFSSPFAVSNGIYVTWKRVVYGGHLTFLGRSTPSKAYQSAKYSFGDTASFHLTYNSLYIGYEVIRKPQFIVAPFAGLSTFRMSRRDIPDETPGHLGPLKASIIAGLVIDWRSQAFFQNNHCQLRYGLNTRISYSPYEYAPGLRGNCISVSMGLSFYLDAVKNYL